MFPQPEFKILKEKKLIGKCLTMSFANNRTAELWKSFMPFRNTITNYLSEDLFSLHVYGPAYFENFNPDSEFEKWALMEVPDFGSIPDGMKSFTLTAGLYAVFQYKGLSSDHQVFDYIFGTWLPESRYSLDDRPHFQILGNEYKNADQDSEEDIWIPIASK